MSVSAMRVAHPARRHEDAAGHDQARELCRDLVASIAGGLGLPDVVVYLRRDDGVHFEQAAAIGAKCDAAGALVAPLVVRAGEGIVGAAAGSARLVCIDDCDRDPRYLVDDACRRSELCVPIVHRDDVLGVIDAEHPQAAYFGEKHCAAFALAADLVAPRLARLLLAAPPALAVVRAPPVAVRSPVALDRDGFDRVVAQVLRHLHDARRLRASPLARGACVTAECRAGDDAALALRRLVLDAIDAIAQSPGTADQARLLRRRFVEPCASQSRFAEAMHVGESTLRRHVQRATALLASELWRRESLAANAPA